MTDGSVAGALERAGRALDRIERALDTLRQRPVRDEALRARVREAIAELDDIIGSAG